MSRYIDAEKLMEQVVKKKPETAKVRWTEGFNDAIARVRSMIHSAPTADVVEVVRCKNCRYFHKEKGGWCEKHDFEFDVDDYCRHGERNENDR